MHVIGLGLIAAAARLFQPVPPAVLEGRVVDPEGKPIPGVKLQVYGGLATRFAGPEAITDDRGEYRFDPLETGAIMFDDEDRTSSYSTGVRVEHDSYCAVDGNNWWDVTVPWGGVTRFDLTMIRGGSVSAIITTNGGARGVGGLDVRVLNAQEPTRTTVYATTDHRGRFSTSALAPGEYSIQWNWPAVEYVELARVRIESGVVSEIEIDMEIHAASRVVRVDEGEAK